jgi:hypothetical protein
MMMTTDKIIDVGEIMTALDAPVRGYEREAVQAAMDQKEEVCPLLLEYLTRVLRDPAKYSDPDENDSFLPIYAVTLLGHHRVREAHTLLIELMSLPGEMPFDLLGDAVLSVCIPALWKTSGGDPTDIVGLIENRRTNGYCRSSAIKALTYGVADGTLPRERVIEVLQGLFTGDESSPADPLIGSYAAANLAKLWPGESMEVLKKAYDDGLIERGYIGLQDIEAYLDEGKEARLAAFEREALKDLAATPHEDLQWWACFQREGGRPSGLDRRRTGRGSSLTEQRKRTANKMKRKRKQARAARKKARTKKKKGR